MTTDDTCEPRLSVAGADAELDARLSSELTAFNLRASGADDVREITVRVDDEDGLVAGLSGWSWGGAAGIELVWVRADARTVGWGGRLLAAAEQEAAGRGCRAISVSSHLPGAGVLPAARLRRDDARPRPAVRGPRGRVVPQAAG